MRFLFFIIFILFLGSCSVSKYLPTDKTLYTGAEVQYETEEELKNKKKIESDIQSSIYPLPNDKILGLFYFRLWVYFRYADNHEKGISKWLFNQFGEEAVYTEDVNIDLMEDIIQKKMQDNGYFNSKVNGKLVFKKGKSKAEYIVTPTGITMIDTVYRPSGNTDIDRIVKSYKALKVKEGQIYKLADIDLERDRLAKSIRSLGFYDFDLDDIFYLVDTSADKSVDIYMRIRKPEHDSIFRKYYISSIDVYTTSGSRIGSSFEQAKNNYEYQGLNIYEDYRFIDKKTLAANILIEKDQIFNISAYNRTLSRLINLNVFKYVNIQYKKVGKDSLHVEILLTPTLYKGLQYDIQASTSDRSFLGSTISASFFNNNALHKAERMSTSFSTGAEFQYVKSSPRLAILNANVQLKYTIPRLLIPWKKLHVQSKETPTTSFTFEEDFQLWLEYFTMNSVNLNYGYDLNPDNAFSFSYDPIFINLVNVFSTTAEFDSIIDARPLVGISYQDNVLIGSLFSTTYNSKRYDSQMNYMFGRLSLETAGNTSSLAASAFQSNTNRYTIANVPISQYVRTDLDIRLTRDFNDKMSWVSRINIGGVLAYGNSEVAPFTKQFFMGGPTTLRGFEYRSVGPGRYKPSNVSGFSNPLDQSGDLRILFNTEYRFPIYSIFRGAFFVDAGNIWLLKEDVTRPSGQFDLGSFYQEFALNSGIGLRIDIDLLAFRIDLGVPMYEPYRDIDDRWIFDSYSGGASAFLSEMVVISAGIGYPF